MTLAASCIIGGREHDPAELDTATLEGCRAGDPGALRLFVTCYEQRVFAFLSRTLGAGPHVEDLAQEVFLRLHRALPGFRGQSLLSTYLYRITVNVAQDEWKRRRREDRPLISISDETSDWEDRLVHPDRNAEEQIADGQFQQAVEEHLGRLSSIERTVLVLYHQEERTYEQIAVVLGLPLGTVRTHLHRARKRLREALQTARAEERKTPCTT